MPSDYEKYFQFAKFLETRRLGYPLGGGNRNQFFASSRLNQGVGVLEMFPEFLNTLLINIGDPESTATEEGRKADEHYPEDVEYEILEMLSAHFGSSLANIKGYVTTGGTEANLAAIWWLRNYLLSVCKSHSIRIFISDQAHYCSQKIADILGLKLVLIKSNENGSMNIESLDLMLKDHGNNFSEQGVIVWTTVGTTVLGASDDILDIKKLLDGYKELKSVLHVDGAILGITIPVLKEKWMPLFDTADSLAISGHKLLGTIPVCGAVLCRRQLMQAAFSHRDVRVAYVHGVKDITVTGGRWSIPIFALHFALKSIKIGQSKDALASLVRIAFENTDYFVGELRRIVGDDEVQFNSGQFNVVFPLPRNSESAKFLKEYYTLMSVGSDRACVSIFPQVKRKLLETFINDYELLYKTGVQPIIKLKL